MMPTLLNNRYRILQAIGIGGFGETYLAADTQMPSSRRCAIKQLKPITDNTQIHQRIQERFQLEAAILEKLSESNRQIPRLYAYFEEAGQFYLVQEWIKGETLTAHVQNQGCLPESEVHTLLMNLLPVLNHIHSNGIIHRDIKPDNIILRHRDGLPVLIDFGAVKETMGTVLDSKGNAASSLVVGTSGFMPSEQAAGRPLYSSDLYSLGLTAIYLLTGKIPQDLEVNERTGEILWRHYVPYISHRFAAVIDKAMRFHPRDRYATAKEMLAALKALPSPLPKTEPSLPPPTVIFQRLANQKQSLLDNLQQWQASLKEWQKAAVAGVLVGAFLGMGLMGRTSEAASENGAASAAVTTEQTADSDASSAATCRTAPPSRSFYFLADSAFLNPSNAQKKCNTLVENGHEKAGVFYSQSYSSLRGQSDYKVYVDRFGNLPSCEAARQAYVKQNPGAKAYCALAAKK